MYVPTIYFRNVQYLFSHVFSRQKVHFTLNIFTFTYLLTVEDCTGSYWCSCLTVVEFSLALHYLPEGLRGLLKTQKESL